MDANYTDRLYKDLRELQRRTGIDDDALGFVALELIREGCVNGRILQVLDENGCQVGRVGDAGGTQ